MTTNKLTKKQLILSIINIVLLVLMFVMYFLPIAYELTIKTLYDYDLRYSYGSFKITNPKYTSSYYEESFMAIAIETKENVGAILAFVLTILLILFSAATLVLSIIENKVFAKEKTKKLFFLLNALLPILVAILYLVGLFGSEYTSSYGTKIYGVYPYKSTVFALPQGAIVPLIVLIASIVVGILRKGAFIPKAPKASATSATPAYDPNATYGAPVYGAPVTPAYDPNAAYAPAPEAPVATEAPAYAPAEPAPVATPAPVAPARFCSSCGAKVTEGSSFCTSCGAKLN